MSITLRRRELRSGRMQLYLDLYQCGTRKREALNMFLDGDRFQNKETLKLAEAIRARRELDLSAQMHGMSSMYKRRANFIEYGKMCSNRAETASTKRSYYDALGKLVKYRGENIVFGQLSLELFEGFKEFLLREVSRNTAQMYFCRVKSIVNHAVREGILPVNPAAFVSIKKEDRMPKYLTLKEVRGLSTTKCPNEDVKAAFLFACFTGLRYSDVERLTWDKVVEGHLEYRQKKTGGAERLPLCSQAKAMLEEQRTRKPSKRIVVNEKENLVFHLPGQATVDKELKKWAVDAGIGKSLSFHKARHTFATMSLQFGVDIYTVSKLLGHKNLQSTEVYAKVVDEKKRQAMEKLPMLTVITGTIERNVA